MPTNQREPQAEGEWSPTLTPLLFLSPYVKNVPAQTRSPGYPDGGWGGGKGWLFSL